LKKIFGFSAAVSYLPNQTFNQFKNQPLYILIIETIGITIIFYRKEALLDYKPAITMTLAALAIVGAGYIVSILPQPIIWAISILFFGFFVFLTRNSI